MEVPIKRYKVKARRFGLFDADVVIEEDEDGDWVRYLDLSDIESFPVDDGDLLIFSFRHALSDKALNNFSSGVSAFLQRNDIDAHVLILEEGVRVAHIPNPSDCPQT